MAFGDLDWATWTHGTLRGFERFVQTWQIMRFRLTRRLRDKPKVLGLSSPAEVERLMAEIELPRTELVARAASHIEAMGPPALSGHVLRTWAWGALLGIRDGLAFDREIFALSALLHDIGLVQRTTTSACFAADGAGQALVLLERWGATPTQRSEVANAVCLHLRVTVPPELGVEAHLVHAGSAMDVIGAGLAGIAPEIRQRVLARHPRADLKRVLCSLLSREHDQHPDSRIGLWVSLGFLQRVRAAPFDE